MIKSKKEYQHDWYVKHKEEHKKRVKENNKRYGKRNKEYVKEYLETHPCVDCGNSDIRVLEFDHVRGTKEKDISYMITSGRSSLSSLRKEIEKCEIRCANCHRIKTKETYLRV